MVKLDINGSIDGDSDALETVGNLDNVVSRLERLHEQGFTVQLQVDDSQLGDGGGGAVIVAKIQDA